MPEEAPQVEAPENETDYTYTDSSILEYTIIGGKKKKKKKKKKKLSRQDSHGSTVKLSAPMQPIEEEKEEAPPQRVMIEEVVMPPKKVESLRGEAKEPMQQEAAKLKQSQTQVDTLAAKQQSEQEVT